MTDPAHSRIRSGYWQDLTSVEIGELDASATVAILPVAAIEQHGPHLPLATDALINAGIVARTLELAPPAPVVLVLPAQNIGHSPEHLNFAGTLSVAAATLLDLWSAVALGAVRAGIRRIVILNSHGGQKSLVDLLAVRLRAEHGVLAVRASYFGFGAPQGLFDADELAHGIHGGEIETSLLLHLAPDLVRREALANFSSWSADAAADNRMLGAEKPIGIGWLSEDLNPAGVCGNAARADAQRGRRYLEHVATSLVTLLGEVAAARPNYFATT